MKRSRWPSHRLSYLRMLTVLAAAGCAALSLVMGGGAVASGSVAAGPSSVTAGPVLASRFGAWRLEPPGLGRAGHSLAERLSNVAQAGPGRRGGFVVLDGSPGVPVASPKTHTLYVPIQCTTGACTTPEHVVDVINTATCNTKVISGCRVVASAKAGRNPLAAAIDPGTGTLYVVNGGSNTVSVLNSARCNAQLTRGCRPVATVKVGAFPVDAAFSPATRTLYVASPNGYVFVINAARCNAMVTRGCKQPVKAVKVKQGPQALDVDMATDTVYTANTGSANNGNTVSVINGAACNGHTSRGCGRVPVTVTVGSAAWWVTVDQASGTVYVANNNDGTASVINGARCNGHVTAGCHGTPPTMTVGASPQFVTVDYRLHTVFTVNNQDDTLSAINTRTCSGTVTSGCQQPAPSQQATPDQGPGFNSFPNALALIPRTGTAYVLTVGGRNLVSVKSIRRCNAIDTSGCRRPVPSAPVGEYLLSADPATNTIYGGNLSQPQIDVINGATCHAADLSGCTPVAEIPMPDPQANVGAIDPATHTLYASDESPSGTLAVINTATCNAGDTAGCAAAPAMVKIGAFPNAPVINPTTHTVYVSYGSAASKVAVVNGATCNAENTTGCGQAPGVVKVGQGTFALAVSAATDTVYAPATGQNFSFSGNTVALINGATCNGTNHTGCGHLAGTAKVGLGPFGIAVDDRTHTVYVTNNADGDSPGTVSVINGATCNAATTTGCHRRFPVAAAGVSPSLVAVDALTDTIYVTNISSASVTILHGRRCNAEVTKGCRKASRGQAVGSQPFGIAVNPLTRSVYVTNLLQAGSLSIFPTGRQ